MSFLEGCLRFTYVQVSSFTYVLMFISYMNILPFQPISTSHIIVVLKWGCCGCCRLKLWKGDNQHVRNQAPTRRGRGGNWCTKWINCYWSWCFPKGIIQQWYVTCYWDFWLIKSLLKTVVFLSFEKCLHYNYTILCDHALFCVHEIDEYMRIL